MRGPGQEFGVICVLVCCCVERTRSQEKTRENVGRQQTRLIILYVLFCFLSFAMDCRFCWHGNEERRDRLRTHVVMRLANSAGAVTFPPSTTERTPFSLVACSPAFSALCLVQPASYFQHYLISHAEAENWLYKTPGGGSVMRLFSPRLLLSVHRSNGSLALRSVHIFLRGLTRLSLLCT